MTTKRTYQSASTVLMVEPTSFRFNDQTSESNAFQKKENTNDLTKKVLHEFDRFQQALEEKGVEVVRIKNDDELDSPDAVFPNNWFSLHANGTLIIYPMMAPNRRLERDGNALKKLRAQYNINQTIDLTYFEEQNKFLEGTGSIVFDHQTHIAYAALSPRTDAEVLMHLCEILNYQALPFESYDINAKPIYHTNVILTIGTNFAILCSESISDPVERQKVIRSIEGTNKEIIDINFDQMNCFAGNMLEVRSKEGQSIIVMSKSAHTSLNEDQLTRLKKHGEPLIAPLDLIERIGGGSARCMLAEIFLP